MKVGSLFSGIGGIEIGFEKAGFTTEWFIECELYAQAVLKKRFPKSKIYGDITKIDFTTLPKVQVLTGGFPCQDISIAGRKEGITGKKSSLWKYYLKAIREIRPEVAFIENVSALTKRGLDVVLSDLAKIGYDAEWYCLPASAVGAPHKRERIFILAYPNKVRWNDGVHNDSQYEIHRNKEWNFPQNFKSGHEWKRWIIQNFQVNDRNVSESYFHRMDDGLSKELDRIKCLGNAVVPQIAEIFAKAIKEEEKGNVRSIAPSP